MVDYASAIKKPFEDMQTLLLGIIIGLVPFLNIFISGYSMGVGRNTLKGNNKMPKWDPNELVQYIKDIIIGFVISLVYQIPAIIVGLVGAAATITVVFDAVMQGNQEALITGIIGALAAGGLFFTAAIILAVIGGALSLMGVMYYLKTGSIMSAFNIGGCVKKVLTVPFWSTVVVTFIYGFVLGVIATILSIVPIIGSLVGMGLATFLLATTSNTMFAQVFKETK